MAHRTVGNPLRRLYRWLFADLELPLAEGEWRRVPLGHARGAIGQTAEKAAAAHLRRKGHRILCRNRANGSGELDLVTRSGQVVVFVEVRSRRAGGPVSAASSLTARKREAWKAAAAEFLRKHHLRSARIRYDLVAVETSPEGHITSVVHHENLRL
jgi:putative endonuclease